MSRRYWLPIIAVVGLALTGAAFAQPVEQDAGRQPGTSKSENQPHADETPLALKAIKDQLERLTGAYVAEINKPEPTEKEERAKRDLAAQEGMARWAYWMVWAAAAEALLTLIGIFLVWRTLVHTRRAADAAADAVTEARNATTAAQDAVVETRRIGEAQVRAYISWDAARVGFVFQPNDMATHCVLTAAVKNTGQSPAQLVGLYSDLVVLNAGETPKVRFDPSAVACSHSIGAGNTFDLIEQHISLGHAVAAYGGKQQAYLLGWAAYRDVFSLAEDPDHILTFCFECKFRNSPTIWRRPLVESQPAVNFVTLTSIPNYDFGPSGPYK